MDSLAPNSISIVMCDQGNVDTTLDRKIEADLCLLLLPLAHTFGVNEIIDNNKDMVCGALAQHNADVKRKW